MKYQICNTEKNDYLQLIELWEQSVRATHDFLPYEEIARLKPLILDKYFDAVLLKCVKDAKGQIVGFLGIADNKIEMLFILPAAQGQGVSAELLQQLHDP